MVLRVLPPLAPSNPRPLFRFVLVLVLCANILMEELLGYRLQVCDGARFEPWLRIWTVSQVSKGWRWKGRNVSLSVGIAEQVISAAVLNDIQGQSSVWKITVVSVRSTADFKHRFFIHDRGRTQRGGGGGSCSVFFHSFISGALPWAFLSLTSYSILCSHYTRMFHEPAI